MNYYIGIDIGGTKCAVILARNNSSLTPWEDLILERIAFLSDPYHPDAAIREFIRIIDGLLKTHLFPGQDALKGIGISCGGPLDSRGGRILCPPNLPGWTDVPICSILKERYHCTVVLENDANACAMAEWKFGAAKTYRNVVFLTFGTGLGAGLILNGSLYSGTNDMAGEVGHVKLSEYGPVGYGKMGTMEGFCSGGGIAQLAQMRLTEALQSNQLPDWCDSHEKIPLVTAKTVAEAANSGDSFAISIYRECGKWLGRGLAILVDILNPEAIVIGSIYQRCENLLQETTLQELKNTALPRSVAVCEIKAAALGNRIGDYAAISLVM